METLVLVLHILTALSIIGLILIQQGKGASMGASFGSGASQTVFGSSGGGHFLVKVTAAFAVVFFVTSFSLAVIAKNRAAPEEDFIPGLEEDIPAIEEQIDQIPDAGIPVIEETTNDNAGDIPVVEETQSASEEVPAVEETNEPAEDAQ